MSDAHAGCELVVTRSGARAMRDRATGEVMHPVVGPVHEAVELYLAPSRLADRLAASSAAPLVLYDVGLGAGSNAVAAWRLSESLAPTARRLEIVSFDRSVEALRLALEPAHCADFGFDAASAHAARTMLEYGRHANARTTWQLVLGELPHALTHSRVVAADVVYWDPFSPRANPLLWNTAAFTALRAACGERAVVHTYSGATAVRSALLLAGFAVGIGTPTSTARAGTIAAVNSGDLAVPLDARWLQRLTRSSAALPHDAPSDALARIAMTAQFRDR